MNDHSTGSPRQARDLVPPWAATTSSLGGGVGAATITIHGNPAVAVVVLLILQAPTMGNLTIKYLHWRLYDHVVRGQLTRCADLAHYERLLEDIARTQPVGERLPIDQTRHPDPRTR